MSKRRWIERLKKKASSTDQLCKADQLSQDRHVYIESGVEIDLAEDLRNKYVASQAEENRHKKDQLFWTKVSTLLIAIYAALTLLIYCETQKAASASKSVADTAAKQLIEFENIQSANIVLQFADEHEVYERNGDLYIRGTVDIQNVGQTSAMQFIFRKGTFNDYKMPDTCPSGLETMQPDPYGPAISPNEKKAFQYVTFLGNAEKIRNREMYAGITLHYAYRDIFGKVTSVSTWYTYIPNRQIFIPCIPDSPEQNKK